MHIRKGFWLLVIVLALVLGVSGTQAQQEPVTLVVWDQFYEETTNPGMEELVAAFEEANPNITIERQAYNFQDMHDVLRTALASGTGPDVFYYGGGAGFLGPLVDAGLVMPLEDAYETQGWNDYIFEWTKRDSTFDEHVYGIGNELEFIGVYYNMDIFEELGLEVPTTYEEFIAVCDAVKEAGYIPIAFADGPGWPAYHQFSIMTNNLLGKDRIEEALFGEGRWDDPDVIRGIQMFFVDMNQAGYFIPETTAVSYEDGNALFYNGMAAMHMTGTWLIGDIVENMPDTNVGFFFFPSIDGGEVLPPGGLGSVYFISSATEHPDEAIAFLDFLFDPANARIWMEDIHRIPPYAVDTTDFDLPDLMKFAVQALQEVQLGYNIDVLTPQAFNDAMLNGFQGVLLGDVTPEEVAAQLQAAMEAYRAEQAGS
jgi:raffinose/stachyose/melibiose transport system substrate-binding protein